MFRCGIVTVAIWLVAEAPAGFRDVIPEEARAILEKAEQIELLSLDPVRPKEKPKDEFHGWKVLGKTLVKDAETREKVVAAFKKGVAESDGSAFCFDPRHGLHVTSGGKTADFVVCFECSIFRNYLDGIMGRSFEIANSPELILDKILTDAKVPLAPKPKKEKPKKEKPKKK